MTLLNAQTAIATLLNLMAVPGVFATVAGGYLWFNGNQQGKENKSRMGRMLLMFGIILLAIVLILSFFIAEYNIMKPGSVNHAANL